jgi:hypothetical protein
MQAVAPVTIGSLSQPRTSGGWRRGCVGSIGEVVQDAPTGRSRSLVAATNVAERHISARIKAVVALGLLARSIHFHGFTGVPVVDQHTALAHPKFHVRFSRNIPEDQGSGPG